MAKPWGKGEPDPLSRVYDMAPGPTWGTIIIDGVVEKVDGLEYRRNGSCYVVVRDGFFYIKFRPVEYEWAGKEIPEELRGKWSIEAVEHE